LAWLIAHVINNTKDEFMKNGITAEKIEALALAIPVIVGGIWWIFTVSATASDAKAMIVDKAPIIEDTHDRVLKIEKDIEYIKEILKNK
jgi:hypothetical protein